MQRKVDLSGSEYVFVVETCQNCKDHHWNTRHDESKYEDFFNKISSAIISRIPNAVVLRNQIPKSYVQYDLYCNLVPNEDDGSPIYDWVPRTGSFEVSYKGMLIFSKLQSSYWPNTQLVGEKCYLLVQDEKDNKDLTRYLAGNSPVKGASKSRTGPPTSKSPIRGYNDSNTGFSGANSNKNMGSPAKQESQKFSSSSNVPVRNQSTPNQAQQQQKAAEEQKQKEESERRQRELQEQQLREQQQREKELREQQEREQKQREAEAQRAEQERLRREKEESQRQEEERLLREQQEREERERQEQEQALNKSVQDLNQSHISHQSDPKFLDHSQSRHDTIPAQASIHRQPTDEQYANEFEEPEPNEVAPEEDIEVGAHLKTPDDLFGYPIFPPGTHSLLKKFMTRELWSNSKNLVDSHGYTFKHAIFTGCKNVDSHIGVIAGSHDSYNAFAELFDQIIVDYHGHEKSAVHHSDMDYTKLNCPPFSAKEQKLIRSTRIRVGRNLAEYPLGPGLSREQRVEIEQKVVQALSSFEGELAGTFYSLGSLSDDEKKQLIADHFLFKEGDRFQEASFLNRDWPEGRGIFHNASKTFLVWVNEEDQLRIISMQNGADIGAVFTRLSKACAHIETVAKFAHDEHLGYITSCPTNLGTGLRASVHVYLPNLGQRKDEFQAIADQYHVQIRGAHGEHTETNDHIYDISNKRRLGISEVSLVQDMYNGVKALLQRELELKPKKELTDIEVGRHLQTFKDLKGFPIFPDGTKSLLSKYLTREIFEQLSKLKDKHGFSFKQAIFSGCQNTDSGIGVYAGSHDSYYTFASFFDHIVQDYHGHGKDDKHVSDMDYTKLECPPFAESDAQMIKSTRIRVGRNLADYPLGPGLTKEQRKEIESKVVQALSSFEGELEGKYYALSALSEADRKQLIADHFLFKEGDRFLEAVGLNREWPDGRGIFHNNEKTFLVWVNEEDQLRIISMQNGADIGAVFTRLSKACTHIETVAKFSHDDHLGYITSCPTNLGTALRASVHIHLPYLGQNKAEFQAIADRYHVQIRGAHGEHTETDDHIYDISNKRRLGRSEVDLVQDMYNGVKAMIEKEKELSPQEEEEKEEDILSGAHLKSPSELTGFPLFPQGTKSLLMKHLTREVWDELKNASDKHGFSFKQAIFSGCQNTDSGIGIYAGSHDSYTAFAPLMDQVIETYHGHAKDANHVSDMDYTKLNCPPLSNKEQKLIKSTRIRVGRNLADYPLGPGLTDDQRNEIEKTVVEALSSFEGELAGKYYALSSLSEDERKQLIADHFLFKEGDRFLEAVGLNRNWPEGRGIFHNNEKTFLVWVNEEDQLRIISMQNGADIGAVFTRLSKACAHIETVAKFSHDEHLGYITSCPTNLGTALRASVHIHLPNLGQVKSDFQAIADKYHVQIRGAHGEHTETDDHIYDISNKRRLGRSEVDLVQDMYNGVKAMIQKELELAPAKEPKQVQAGSHLKSPEELTGFPVFPAGTKSLLSKYLTSDLWKQLKNLKDKYGFSFKQAIFSGSQNTDSGIGVYAGSHDSYVTFASFFDHIIQDYHGHAKDANHVSDMDYTKLECPPLRNSEAKLIRSTRIRVGRNLADYPLGPGLTREQRNEIEQKVVQALQSFEGELEGKYYALSALSDDERKQLIADHFLFKEGDRFLEAVGLNRDWPEGRGIFHNNDKTFLVWVNEEDQLRIISMQNGADIGAVFTRLSKACAHIETVAKFAHDEHLGYITSCPTNLGTALRASVHIHLPHLGQHKDEFQAIADQFHVQIRGAHGEHTETDDHIYDISNKRRLGRSEVDLVQDMYNGVKAMIVREKQLRPPKVKPEAAVEINVEESKQQAEKIIQCGPQLAAAIDLKGKSLFFPPGTKSLLSQFCTKDVWLANKKKKDSFGFSFKQAIFSGCKNVDSGIGVYAGSQDSYHAFSDLFNPIIQTYHGFDTTQNHVSDMDHTKLECPPLEDGDADNMIVSTRIRVGRNLADYPLGPGLTKEQRVEIEEKVSDALQSFEGDLKGKYYSLGSLTEEERQKLIDEHFLFKEGDRFLEAAGLNRDWPEGRGIFHNDELTFLVWVNEEDQLRIISMQKGCDIGAVFERLSRACAHIEQTIKFAHDEHLGYITSCPTNLGTALRASVHIRLPKLSQQMEEFEAIANKFHVQIRGIHGEHSETVDSVYDISNKRRLGLSEVSLVQDMYNGVKALIDKEKSL